MIVSHEVLVDTDNQHDSDIAMVMIGIGAQQTLHMYGYTMSTKDAPLVKFESVSGAFSEFTGLPEGSFAISYGVSAMSNNPYCVKIFMQYGLSGNVTETQFAKVRDIFSTFETTVRSLIRNALLWNKEPADKYTPVELVDNGVAVNFTSNKVPHSDRIVTVQYLTASNGTSYVASIMCRYIEGSWYDARRMGVLVFDDLIANGPVVWSESHLYPKNMDFGFHRNTR